MVGNTQPALFADKLALGLSENRAGAHLARSMMLHEMRALVRALPVEIMEGDFERAVVGENLLDKPTNSSRLKTFRHLVELYGLDLSKAVFRVFWMLSHQDLEALPHLCLVCAYARDPLFRHSFSLIEALKPGEVLEREVMEQHFEDAFPKRFSAAMKKSLAQNVNTSWTNGGHLSGRAKKLRHLPEPRPVSAAYAMFVGYIEGLRGERLIDSKYAALVSTTRSQLQASLALASARGLLTLKQAAGVIEFDFSHLLTPAEQELIHESD